MADTPGAARSLALAFAFPEATQWRTAMLNLPVFPDNSPQGFYDRLLASKVDPATGKPDPAAMSAFLAAHPETAAAMAVIKQHPPTPGFADSTFRGLNTFFFVNEAGRAVPRFGGSSSRLQASQPARIGHTECAVRRAGSPDAPRPAAVALKLTIGSPGDPLLDATLPWPSDRRTIDAGVLTLTDIETEGPGNARDVNFDPLVLPDGIEPSDDPLLSARSAVYAASYRARTGEPKSPSVVQVDEVAP